MNSKVPVHPNPSPLLKSLIISVLLFLAGSFLLALVIELNEQAKHTVKWDKPHSSTGIYNLSPSNTIYHVLTYAHIFFDKMKSAGLFNKLLGKYKENLLFKQG